MSRLIDEDIFNFNNKLHLKYQQLNNKSQCQLKNFKFKNQLKSHTFQQIALDQVKINTDKCLKILVSYKKKLFSTFDIWYQLIIDESDVIRSQKLIISKEQFLFQINNYKKKLIALQIINSIKRKDLNISKLYINDQGIITIQLPRFISTNSLINSIEYYKKPHKSFLFSTYLQTFIIFILQDINYTLNKIFQKLTNLKINQINGIVKQNQTRYKKLQNQIYRCLNRMPIQLNLNYSQSSRVYTKIINITIQQQQLVKQRIKFINQNISFKLDSIQLYLDKNNIIDERNNQKFYFSQPQKQIIKTLLQISQIIPHVINNSFNSAITQNKYLLNQILLDSIYPDLKYLTQSGFGKLQYSKFNFWYIKSQKVQNQQFEKFYEQKVKIKNKYIIIKSPKFPNNYENYRRFIPNKYYFKHQHEINIIKNFKGLSCIYFTRYYQVSDFYSNLKKKNQNSANQNQMQSSQNQIYQQNLNQLNQTEKKIKNSILIQLTNFHNHVGYNLRNLIQDRSLTLSLKKVMFITTQIAQALRFLHQQKIIHLDLKPQNILILKNFSIKLVDFGEAYHPQVQYTHTRPGYTYPYGCPQIALNQNICKQDLFFTQKSDVFSFGIIFFQLLYGKDLFTSKAETLLNLYKNQTYYQKIFVAHQQNQQYGQKFILPILNHLIFKCLQTNPKDRPSMTWIAVILKYCFKALA